MDLLVRMDMKTNLADKRFTIDQLRHQISTEDTSLLNHQEAMRKCRKEVRLEKKEMEEGGNSDDQYYRQAVEEYEEAMKSVTKISRRIETLHEELHLCKKEYDAHKAAPDEPEDANDNSGDDDGTKKQRDDEDMISISSNDGSMDLSESEIPREEQVV